MPILVLCGLVPCVLAAWLNIHVCTCFSSVFPLARRRAHALARARIGALTTDPGCTDLSGSLLDESSGAAGEELNYFKAFEPDSLLNAVPARRASGSSRVFPRATPVKSEPAWSPEEADASLRFFSGAPPAAAAASLKVLFDDEDDGSGSRSDFWLLLWCLFWLPSSCLPAAHACAPFSATVTSTATRTRSRLCRRHPRRSRLPMRRCRRRRP